MGGFEPCIHLPTFTVGVLPFELQDFLLFGGYCKSSSLNHSGLPWTAIVDFKTQDICHYFIKSLQDLSHPGYMLDNDDSFHVVSCLYKLFGSRLQIGHIQIRTGTTTPLVQPFLVTKWYSLPIIIIHLCDPAGTRTRDPYIKSVLLCQLSYETFPYNLNQVPLFSFRRTNRRFTRFFLSDLTFPTGRIGLLFQ